MAIPIELPARPVWPRAALVLFVLFSLYQASGSSGDEPDACHHLARWLAAAAAATTALYYASENYKASGVYGRLFLLAYWGTSVLFWAAPPILVARSEKLLRGEPCPPFAALGVVYLWGLYLFAAQALGSADAAAPGAWLRSLNGGAGVALMAAAVLAPGHRLAAWLQRRYPHMPLARPAELTPAGLESFFHRDGLAALAVFAALVALQYALFTPVKSVVVLGSVVLDEPVARSALYKARKGAAAAAAAAAEEAGTQASPRVRSGSAGGAQRRKNARA
jgi:hypothetical protein